MLKTSGEYIEFKKPKGRIVKDNAMEGEIEVVGGVIDEAGIREKVSIPISEIELVWVKKINTGKTVLLVAIPVALSIHILSSLKEASCPFIYSFDGDKYIFDAEPYAGAVCEGLKRMEWCGLQHLKEVNKEYRIFVTNEMDETQYTDELKLLVVDHPRDIQVVPDTWGGIHTISNPMTPFRAYDQKGNDLTSDVCENDRVLWLSQEEGKNPVRKEDLRDELIFEFPKPKDASRAKLLFNGCNTLWGSELIKRYLELYGKHVFKWYDEMKNFGPAFFKL